MFAEKYIKQIKFCRYLLKNTGFLKYVPLIVLNLLVPAYIALSYLSGSNFLSNLLMITQYAFPFFSAWYSLFALKELVESDGKETLLSLGSIDVLFEAFVLFIPLLADVALLMAICSFLLPVFSVEFFRIIPVCIIYFALAYCVSVWFKSTSISLFVLIISTLINVVFRTHIMRFPLFMNTRAITSKQVPIFCTVALFAAALFMILGKIAENRFLKAD